MSVRVTSLVWRHYHGLPCRKLVLLRLADHGDDKGDNIFPSVAELGHSCSMKASQARRHLHGVIDEGLVEVVANAGGGAPGMTRHYRIRLDRLKAGCGTARKNASRAGVRTANENASRPNEATASGNGSPTAIENARTIKDARASKNARDGYQRRSQTAIEDDSQTVIESSLTVEPARPEAARKLAFDDGLAILRAAGTAESQARRFLGKLIRDHGDDQVLTAIRAMKSAKPIDPRAWLVKKLRPNRARDADLDSVDYSAGLPTPGAPSE